MTPLDLMQALRADGGNITTLRDEPFCHVCSATLNVDSAMRCSRCLVVHYCNRACQTRDFKTHKAFCKNMKGLYGKLACESDKLRNFRGREENLFETRAGRFSSLFLSETAGYMQARLAVACAVVSFLNEQMMDNALALDVALEHILDLVRLCRRDDMGSRFEVASLLLRRNRDDDAYAFCLHCIKDPFNKSDVVAEEGAWPYPVEKDCRFNDVFEELGLADDGLKRASLSYVVALLIIKLRIVAALEAQKLREGQAFRADALLQKQTMMRTRLINVVHENNPSMLPAILNPGPLLEVHGNPPGWFDGRPSEAAGVLRQSDMLISCIPGVRKLLVDKLGTDTPSYPCIDLI